jgi:hypothetical protein
MEGEDQLRARMFYRADIYICPQAEISFARDMLENTERGWLGNAGSNFSLAVIVLVYRQNVG